MTTDPSIDPLYDLDGEEPDEWPVRAVETFPVWGQVFAWMTWRCPMWCYFVVFVAGVVLPVLGHVAWGAVMGLLGLVSMAFCLYARTQQLDPFRTAMIVTRRPVPAEDVEAAARGAPVPPERPERRQETKT